MQLACLPPELLPQVCSSLPPIKMDTLLQPLRDLRPVQGGTGWCVDTGMMLRGLNFDLTVDPVEE